jgi:threonine dehydrogenase-like Zn-dependent dehydrogenase
MNLTNKDAKVVWLNAPFELELRTQTLPEMGNDELLCQTLVSVISPGTEIAAYKGLPPLRPSALYPRLQGYCNVAMVIKVGVGVEEYKPGDRILSFMSHRSAFVISTDDVLYKLPEAARADEIACTYLFHLGYNAVLRSGIRAGSNVLVIGLGALGLTAVAMAVLSGAKVFALSDQEAPAAIAKRFGAEAVFRRDQMPALAESLGVDLADVIISTTNGWEDWAAALKMASKLGVIAVLGFPGRGEVAPAANPLDSQYFYMKQLRIEAVGMSPEQSEVRGFCRFNERANIKYLADQILNGRLDCSQLISGEFDGENIDQAYRGLVSRLHSPITYLLKWN